MLKIAFGPTVTTTKKLTMLSSHMFGLCDNVDRNIQNNSVT